MQPGSCFTHLECAKTGEKYDAGKLHNLSAAGAPLLARYDLQKVAKSLKKPVLVDRPANMWRYKELLPVQEDKNCISLGEGFTPFRETKRLGKVVDQSNLFIKDESLNPTGSFKARGISAALSAAIERGATKFAIPGGECGRCSCCLCS